MSTAYADPIPGSALLKSEAKFQPIAGKWLVAVSGGPDSMALLSMCIDAGMEIAAAHVNYHHRKEADEEEAYVRSFCRDYHVKLFVLNSSFHYEGNFEACARSWRYDYFCRIVKEEHLSGVLVAHHLDDLLETYLMQKERNLIPDYYGLKEIGMYHGMCVRRPLLSFTKAELAAYCRKHGIRYYIDSTNLLDDNARNRIRHHVVEPMRDEEKQALLKEIDLENQQLAKTREAAAKLIINGEIDLATYRKQKENIRVSALRQLCENSHHESLGFYQECDGILMKKNDFVIPVQGRLLVSDEKSCFLVEQIEPYRYEVSSVQEALSLGRKKCFAVEKGEPGVNAVTVKDSDFPLVIRSVKEGDSIQMRFGTKKVNRFFIDRHIPRYQRPLWPIVENCRGEVILVSGLGCDIRHYSVKPDFCVIQYPL